MQKLPMQRLKIINGVMDSQYMQAYVKGFKADPKDFIKNTTGEDSQP